MHKRTTAAVLVTAILAVLMLILAGTGGCGPSEADCETVCDWWIQTCTAETRSSCMDDCMDAWPEDVDHALEDCVGSTFSSCKGASCCVRFVYSEYYYNNNCL